MAMNLQDIQAQLEAQRGQGNSFADRLRDERMAFTQTAQQFAAQTGRTNPYTSSSGIPLDPDVVSASNLALQQAIGRVAAPFSPEQEFAARQSEQDLLMNIANLAQANQQAGPVSPIIDPETGVEDYSNFTGMDALSVVNKTGRRLLSGGLNEKKAQAEAILSYGNVDNYLQQAPLSDIYTLPAFKKDGEADALADDFLRKIDYAQEYFSPGTGASLLGGDNLTGPLASSNLFRGFFRPKRQSDAQSALAELSVEKIKEFAGSAVSPTEFERIKKFVPQPNEQENEVANKHRS